MKRSASESSPRERIPTGVPRFDAIVQGGLFRGNVYLMSGVPGSGKTIFANQVCFERARRGDASVFITMLAESHARMLQQIEALGFFSPEHVGTRIHYLSGFSTLEKKGLTGFLALLRKSVEQRKASILVVDGIHTAQDYASSGPAFRRFLRELQAFASLLDCAVLLLSPHLAEDDGGTSAVVDGVIELTHRQFGPRGVRELTVHKFRGSNNLLGRHEVEISDDGIAIHPRTEIVFGKPPESATEQREFCSFGVQAIDKMFSGRGILSGSTTMLLGAPGTGKTVLGLQFLAEGATQGHPGVYFGFYETPPRLLEKAAALGLDIRGAVDSGALEIQWQPPLEHNLDSLAERLLERIKERGVGRLRLFIDGLAGFRDAAVYTDRLKRFFSALTHQLRELDVTTVVSEETPLFHAGVELPNEDFASVVENIILLRHVEYQSELRRLIAVLKSREDAYDPHIREFVIGKRGIQVKRSFDSAQDILQGTARRRTSARRRK